MKTSFKGWHVFSEGMYYRTCVKGHVLWEDMSYERSCLTEDMSYSKMYHEGRNVLHDDMSCEVLIKCNHIFFRNPLITTNIWYLCRSCNGFFNVCLVDFLKSIVFTMLDKHIHSIMVCMHQL